jgi:hypothetical protein
MRTFLILLLIFIIEIPLFSQTNSKQPEYKFGITQRESISYQRKYTNENDSIIRDSSIVKLDKNSLVRILDYKEKNDEFKIESNTKFYTDGTDENDPMIWIHIDTFFIKRNDLIILDSHNVPDKYFISILDPLYGNDSSMPSIINSLDYNKENGLYFISYQTDDGRAAWQVSYLYKVFQDKPIQYIESYCNNCKYDLVKNYVIIYNNERAEIIDTLDYQYDNKLCEYKSKIEKWRINKFESKSTLETNNKNEVLIYNNSKNEFILKRKLDDENKYFYETYMINNGEFKKIK